MTTQNDTKNDVIEFSKAIENIKYCVADLQSRAFAFETIGLDETAKILYHVSNEILRHAENADKLYRNQIHARFQDAQQASANMLAAALAGINITQPKEE